VVRISRFERITNLVLALLDTPRPISLREIGVAVAGYPAEPGALRQAFERDKRTLRDSGIPVAVERIDGDDQVGYRIVPEDYYLPELDLEPEEEDAIAFALAIVRVEGELAGSLATRLGATALESPAPVAVLPELDGLAALHEALQQRHPVRFAYHGRERLVEGYGLVFRRGSWYLVGNERSGELAAVKTFRVDRIEDEPAVAVEATYEVPEGFEARRELRLAPFATGETEGATSVVLEVDAREAQPLARLVGAEPQTVPGATGVELRFSVGDEEALLSFLLGFGDAVELREPERLRERLVGLLTERAAPA